MRVQRKVKQRCTFEKCINERVQCQKRETVTESGGCLFRVSGEVHGVMSPGYEPDDHAHLLPFSVSSQHNVQQHHNSKTKNNTHGGRIRVRCLISLAFGN